MRVAEGQKKNLLGAVSDLKQDAAAEGGAADKGGKAKLFGGRWKKAAASSGGGEQGGGNKSIFGGRWKKPSSPATASPAPVDSEAGAK